MGARGGSATSCLRLQPFPPQLESHLSETLSGRAREVQRLQTRRRGKGKSAGMQGKFTGVQPEPGPEEQRSDKKERGIAMDVASRDCSSLLQPVQGAGHAEKEVTSP